MGSRTIRRLRLIAVATVIAMVPLAIMLMPIIDLPDKKLRQVALSYTLTTSINESSTTVGIADSDLYGMTQADIRATFDQMQSLGVNNVRVLVPWGDVYKVPPGDPLEAFFPPDWSKVDFIVNEANARGMSVLGVINATPYWGGQDGQGCLGCYGAAPDPTKFATFAGQVAARYGLKVGAYEVWNEPNYVASWAPTIDPVAYTRLLKAAYTQIKVNNPDALVVAGVLGAVTSWMGITMDARTFVETMYANDAEGFFDALSIHPYQYTTKFSDGEYDPNVNPHEPWKADSPIEQVIAIRQMMIDNGDADLKIWATEYGLPTGGPNAVTPADQEKFIKDFLESWAELEFAGPSYIYTTRDRIEAVVTEDGSFGLYYFDTVEMKWVAKSAAKVIKDFIDFYRPTVPGNPPGTDLGTQIAQALQAFFAQMQAAMQNFVNQMNVFFDSIAKAIAAIFNPGGALAASLPPEVQDEVAEGTMMAAMTAEEDVADAGADLSESETAKSLAAEVAETEEVTETEEVAPETVPVEEEPTESEEVTETPQEPIEESTEAPETETPETETPETEPEESTEEETAEEEATETDPQGPAAEADDSDASAGTVTEKESREPVRTGLVARPGEVGDDADDADDDAPTADNATNDADSSGGASESGEAA